MLGGAVSSAWARAHSSRAGSSDVSQDCRAPYNQRVHDGYTGSTYSC